MASFLQILTMAHKKVTPQKRAFSFSRFKAVFHTIRQIVFKEKTTIQDGKIS